MPRKLIQFCPQGHDTFIVGRISGNGRCKKCVKDYDAKCAKEIKTGLRKRKSRNQFCSYGHDTFVFGRNKWGKCNGCIHPVSLKLQKRKPHPTKRFCPKGHDKDVVGRTNSNCKECDNLRRKEFQWKSSKIINKDGTYFTMKNYDEAFQIQNGRCANKACNKHRSEFKKAFAVDHDHKTGLFRGLLCSNCNTLLGAMKDNSKIVDGLCEYLLTEKPSVETRI